MSRWFAGVALMGWVFLAGCAVDVQTPGVDVQVGPGGVNVDTPGAKVNVSAGEGVQVKTPQTEVDVDAEGGVKVTAPDEQ